MGGHKIEADRRAARPQDPLGLLVPIMFSEFPPHCSRPRPYTCPSSTVSVCARFHHSSWLENGTQHSCPAPRSLPSPRAIHPREPTGCWLSQLPGSRLAVPPLNLIQ